MHISELLKLKYPDINLGINGNVVLQDNGDGDIHIAEWGLTDPVPTKTELDKWAREFDLLYRQQQAVKARVYPPISDQLDMQYKDIKNGTNTWVQAIDEVKSKWPKPAE